ncbi:hypothetical protein E1B28_010055 [Marasmius oreades]|uniref:Shikimate dehydrogenase substrate binding N-terminal domain-containing protein n=1 Tax=Marasmius oreades TaxID=181124 RepID=A0A9P7RXS6_9AGAR|nr:uncharacterized protein E1B28_010055 [Marasmius oreades]KAG7090988.1 hypothetical protein E1B28_010055 [Marasmius oreades]
MNLTALLNFYPLEALGSFWSDFMSTSSGSDTLFRLYGFPVLHSASPPFHNLIFDLQGQGRHYSTFSTSKIIPDMLKELHSDVFGGCSVTMPIKGAIIPYLDDIEPESKATGAVNTIVKVPAQPESGGIKLIGTNTDILGVKNALLRSLRLQHSGENISSQDRYPPGAGSAVVYGGGATSRSAIYALSSMGLHPIYVVNRDADEVKQVQNIFPELVSRGSLIHLRTPQEVEEHVVQSNPILMVVGAIPAVKPVTMEERMVYTVASHIFNMPYDPPSSYNPSGVTGLLPLPSKRLFLEMAYKPRITPMLKVAAAHGWEPIEGIEAMIEQGYAQQRMWAAGNASATIGSDPSILGTFIERMARDLVLSMEDVIVKEVEVDLAAEMQAAPLVETPSPTFRILPTRK